MKVLSKENLLTLLNIGDRQLFSLNELNMLLKEYGDDWSLQGNQLVKTAENEKMAAIREDISRSTISIKKGE